MDKVTLFNQAMQMLGEREYYRDSPSGKACDLWFPQVLHEALQYGAWAGAWAGAMGWGNGLGQWAGAMGWGNGLGQWAGAMGWGNGLGQWAGAMGWGNGLGQWAGAMGWGNGLGQWAGAMGWGNGDKKKGGIRRGALSCSLRHCAILCGRGVNLKDSVAARS